MIVEQASLASTLAISVGILLLVLGTQILDWYWPVLMFVGAMGYGWYRYGRSLPTDYVVAQRLDAGLALPDTISTAYYFATEDAKKADAGFRERQRAIADETARSYSADQAIPWRLTKYSYAAAALFAVFGGLMVYRYAMERRLDLSRPLVPGVVDLFGSANSTVAQLPKQGSGQSPLSAEQNRNPDDPSNTQEGEKQDAASLGEAPEDVLKTISTPEVSNENSEQFKGKDESGQAGEGGEEQSAGSEKGEGQPGEQSGSDPKQAGKEGKKEGQANSASQQQNGQQGSDKNSMLEKMRDALANLMNKMNVQQPKGGGEQQAKNGQKEGQQGQKGGQQQKGQPNQGKPSDQQGQGEQAGQQSDQQAGQQQQTAQGKGSNDSNDAGSDQPKSGMGKSDGQKDVKLAEQQQALGKLSEIIGKRSERQQGDIMVEVSSSKNQGLRTSYGNKTSRAGNTGGEIHRDEVPLIYQQYVQQYFEQIRKAPPVAAPAGAKAN